MSFLLIPIAAFLAIVALLILKEIKPDSTAKKILKVFIILLFLMVFVMIAIYMLSE